MMSDTQLAMIRSQVQVLQFIVFSLVMGVMAAAVVFIVVVGEVRVAEAPGFLTWFGMLFAVISIAFSMILRRMITTQRVDEIKAEAAKREESGEALAAATIPRLMQTLQVSTIVSCAALEGGAFANVMFFLLDKHALNLVVAGVLTGFILMQVPTLNRARNWFDEQLRGLQ